MKKYNFLILLIILFPMFTLLSQEQIDVIYLNNGDIIKGSIIENVLDDYLKIELSEGSTLIYKYSEIVSYTLFPKEKTSIKPPQKSYTDSLQNDQQLNLQPIMKYKNVNKKYGIMMNAGLSVPSSGEYFSDYWSASYNLGVGIDFYLSSHLALLGYIDYYNFSFNEEKVLQDLDEVNQYNSDGGTINVFYLSLDIKYNIVNVNASKIFPYILGGVGYSNFSITDLDITDNDGDMGTITTDGSIDAFSINFGLGVEFLISQGVSIFVDARYILGFTSGSILEFITSEDVPFLRDDETFNFKLDDNTSYVPFRVGVSYNL